MLYNKYRPRRFSEIVGQAHVITSLRNGVISKDPPRSILLSGGRGLGKTTLARIVPMALNCQNPKDGDPCHKCEACKNWRVDCDELNTDMYHKKHVPKIIARICSTPRYNYRVIILDEIGQIDHKDIREDFQNSLLNIVEDPPARSVVFLLTTEPDKIIVALKSRCMWFKLHSIPTSGIEKRLRLVANKEKIRITNEAISRIARNSDGAMRDALSLLERLRGYNGRITDRVIRDLLMIIKTDKAISCILEERVVDLMIELGELYQVYNAGAILQTLARDLMEWVKGNPDNSRNGFYAGVAYSLGEQSTLADKTVSPLAALQCAAYRALKSQPLLSILPVVAKKVSSDFSWQSFCKFLTSSAELDMVSQEVVAECMFLSSVELEGVTIRYDHALGRDVSANLIEVFKEYESNPYVWERRQPKNESKRRGATKSRLSPKKHRRCKVTKR